MALFKLPVISIGRKPGGDGSNRPPPIPGVVPQSPILPVFRRDIDGMPDATLQEGSGGEGGLVAERTAPQRRHEPRVHRGGEGKNLPHYTDAKSMFLDNAKEVIARCIQAGVIGDSSARDFFRTYSAYLEAEPADGYEDFLSFAYKDNSEQCTQIASMLNSSMEYPLTRLEVEPSRIFSGMGGVLEGETLAFCKKMRTPLLAASTSDLLIFGVCNPYLSRHVEAAFRMELPEMEGSFRYYMLVSPQQMAEAMEKLSG